MFKKLWALINKPLGYIEVPCLEKKDYDYELAREFNTTFRNKKVKNYKKLMRERLVPYVRDLAISQGYLKSDFQCFSDAHTLFCRAKAEGTIDELNNIKV